MSRATVLRMAAAMAAHAVILAIAATPGRAQEQSHRQPPRVPTIVALSMTMGGGPFGDPRFFDGTTPADWPVALVPGGAKVIGGGALGDSLTFRLRVAVFDLGAHADPVGVVRDAVTQAGFTERPPEGMQGGGGFVSTSTAAAMAAYCRGPTMAVLSLPDSVESPGVVSVHLIDGPGGRQACAPRREVNPMRPGLITIPTMSPPRGGGLQPQGSGSNGEIGHTRATLRSTMPADSVLAHFTAQLVAGGWRLDGKGVAGDGVGVQRFLVREREEEWTAALFITRIADLYHIRLDYTPRP